MQLFIIVLLLALISPFSSAQEKQSTDKNASGASMTGSVLQADTSKPVANAQVIVTGPISETESVESDEEGIHRFGATTDEKGNFSFENLKPGAYRVSASRAGMIQKRTGEVGAMTVVLQSGHPQQITVLMLSSGVISGRVLNEHGEPMQNERVTALRYTYLVGGRRLRSALRAETNDKGEYRLFGLKPGFYLVLVGGTASGDDGGMEMAHGSASSNATVRVYAPTYYPNETSPQNAVPIVVKPGDEAQANFSRARVTTHKISGKVFGLAPEGEGNEAEERARYVMVLHAGSMYPAGGGIRKDSSFEIPAVPSGKYTLMAMDSDRKNDERHGFREVVVDASDVTGITIDLDSTSGQVSGFIRTDGESKLDLSKLYLILLPAGSDMNAESGEEVLQSWDGVPGIGYGEVKRDGSFKAELPAMSTVIYAMVGAKSTGLEDWYTSKVLLNGKDVLVSGFKAADAQRGRIDIVISAKGGTVEGTALNSENKPFVDAQIIAVPADPKLRVRFDLMQKATADSQGRFKLRGVRPGEYLVMALEDAEEQPFADEPFLKQNSDKIQKIKVEASTQQVKLQTITMEK